MISLISYVVGALLRTLPWMLIFEWTFGCLVVGSLGRTCTTSNCRRWRREAKERAEWERAFAAMTSSDQRE